MPMGLNSNLHIRTPVRRLMKCKAKVNFKPCRTSMVDLPRDLCELLLKGNVKSQDVIVQLSWKEGKPAFCGWSGEACRRNRLNIDPSFSESIQLIEKTLVTVKAITSGYPIATELELEPKTFQDWELVEADAAYLEDSLVGQTRCVSVNQPVLFFLRENCVSRFIVKQISPPLSCNLAYIDSRCKISISPKSRDDYSRKSCTPRKKPYYHYIPTRQGPTVALRVIADTSELNNIQGYQIFTSESSISRLGGVPEFVWIYGPRIHPKTKLFDKDPKPVGVSPVIARLVICNENDKLSAARLSPLLSVALGLENTAGFIIRLSHPGNALIDLPSKLVVRKFIVDSPRSDLNPETEEAERKQQNLSLCNSLKNQFREWDLVSSCLTNGVVLPRIPNMMAYGGLLEFKATSGGWLKPYSFKKLKLEVGNDVLVEESKTPKNKQQQKHDKTAAQQELLADISKRLTMTHCNAGILISGPSCVGKTSIISEIPSTLTQNNGYAFEVIQCEAFASEPPQAIIRNWLEPAYTMCRLKAPSVLVLENLHFICPMESVTTDSTASRCISENIVSQLKKLIDLGNCSFIITCTSKDAVNPLFLTRKAIEYKFHMESLS